MRIGIVSQWRNQGQATLSRHLRDALESLGHRTLVLARPTRDKHPFPGVIDRDDVWQQTGVEEASRFEIPAAEYQAWARRHSLDVAFFNQNYQFEEVAALRRRGVRTIGYFVWEAFRERDAAPAREAYDVIYSLNRCTRDRYAGMGIASPLLRWGCHPELLSVHGQRQPGGVTYFFPGGLQGPRKPLRATVEAWKRARGPELRLVLKAQGSGRFTEDVAIDDDPRITRLVVDLKCAEYYALFASCDVCLAPSRWEGTGLHLFEASAFGIPVITNDIPPMNELIADGVNGRLVRSHVTGKAKSGIPKFDPDVEDLAAAIEELADPETRARLAEGARARARTLSWEHTLADLRDLLATP
jgi:1,2-diacylglycerol 3-alpha-glucosyltransferase